jgi:hypothetical protein
MRILNTVVSCWLLTVSLLLGVFSGCAVKGNLDLARDYTRQSYELSKKAILQYQRLIAQGKETSLLHFELGLLYYRKGHYSWAIGEFLKSDEEDAQKYLAISYYKQADFTQALKIFERLGMLADQEYLYFYARTCEELNLYRKAGQIYKRINKGPYKIQAQGRLEAIVKLEQDFRIEDLAPQIQKVILGAPDRQAYPEAGALILLAQESLEVKQDNTALYEGHYLIKILNRRGKEDFSEVVIGYDSTYEKVELLHARTIKPDGSIIAAGKKDIRDVSRYLNFPLYSNARAYIISMPQVAEGVVLDYKFRIYKNRLINKKDLVLNYPVQAKEPVLSADFKLILPAHRPAHIKILNNAYNDFGARFKPRLDSANKRLIYRWIFRDIPQIVPEPKMPAEVRINPTFLVSTFDTWQQVYDWWWPLARDKIKTSAAISKKVQELLAVNHTQEDKIRAIYNFCAKEVRYVAVEYGQAGYEPHSAQEIFLNRYGDCKDQAILLVTMLREAGFKAYPVLVGTRDYFNLQEDFPAVLFNHCIVALQWQKNLTFLDPTAYTCSFGDLPVDDQDRKVLVFKEDAYQIAATPSFSCRHNRLITDVKISINSDETITGKVSVSTFGYYDQFQRAWLTLSQPELIKQALQKRIQEISIGGQLIDYQIHNLKDLNQPLILEYTFKGPQYWTTAGDLRILPQLANLDTSFLIKEKRRYPIEFISANIRQRNLEIVLPQNFRMKYLPANVQDERPEFEFKAQYDFKNNTIYFKENKATVHKSIDVADYIGAKKFYENLARRIKQRVVLEE